MFDLNKIKKQLEKVFVDNGLSIDSYDFGKSFEPIQKTLIDQVYYSFLSENKLDYKKEDREALNKLNTSLEMENYLRGAYPNPSKTSLIELFKDLRIESPDYWKREESKENTLENFKAEFETMHIKKLKCRYSDRDLSRALTRLETYLTGEESKYIESGSFWNISQAQIDEKINGQAKSFKVKSFANGRLDIEFNDKEKFKEFVKEFKAYEIEKFKDFLKNRD